jgi:hypothetical protein
MKISGAFVRQQSQEARPVSNPVLVLSGGKKGGNHALFAA